MTYHQKLVGVQLIALHVDKTENWRTKIWNKNKNIFLNKKSVKLSFNAYIYQYSITNVESQELWAMTYESRVMSYERETLSIRYSKYLLLPYRPAQLLIKPGAVTQFSSNWDLQDLFVISGKAHWVARAWVARWLSGRASDLRSSSRGFEAQPRRCCVTTLGKLFTPYCLCHQAV